MSNTLSFGVLAGALCIGVLLCLLPALSTWRRLMWSVALLVPAGAIALYVGLGNPVSLDLAAQNPSDGQMQAEVETLVARLAEKVAKNPDNQSAVLMLARSYATMGRFADALPWYERLAAKLPEDKQIQAQILADYADVLAASRDKQHSGLPEQLVGRALQADPDNLKALALAGTIAFDQKNYQQAIQHWSRVVTLLPPDDEMAQSFKASISQAEVMLRH